MGHPDMIWLTRRHLRALVAWGAVTGIGIGLFLAGCIGVALRLAV